MGRHAGVVLGLLARTGLTIVLLRCGQCQPFLMVGACCKALDVSLLVFGDGNCVSYCMIWLILGLGPVWGRLLPQRLGLYLTRKETGVRQGIAGVVVTAGFVSFLIAFVSSIDKVRIAQQLPGQQKTWRKVCAWPRYAAL